jgi:ubiquitin-protein ligase
MNWHGNIVLPLIFRNEPNKDAIMHIHIQLLEKYPLQAPNVGFCADFEYNGGA